MLRFENVTVSFDGDVGADATFRFDAYEGETRIILGAAGSGKTVLLKTAMGLIKPESGQGLRVRPGHHRRCASKQLFDIRSKIGMLFQESALFDSLNIEENVAYPLLNQTSIKCPPDRGAAAREGERWNSWNWAARWRNFPSELSGGMRRRAAIARAVVTEPPLLLYDSPTAGLDPITAHTIMALLIKERDVSQATTLMVTHRYQDGNLMANFRYNSEQGALEPARNGDAQKARTTFMVMKEGRLVFEGDQDATRSLAATPIFQKFVKQRV